MASIVSYVKPQPLPLDRIEGVQGPGGLPTELWAKTIDLIGDAGKKLFEAAKAVNALGKTCHFLYVLTHELPQVDHILECGLKSRFPKWIPHPKDEMTTLLIGYGGNILAEKRSRFHM